MLNAPTIGVALGRTGWATPVTMLVVFEAGDGLKQRPSAAVLLDRPL